jgi:hypothetical protein
LYIVCFTEKRNEQFKTDITVAYYNAYFQRVAKMPSLSSILEKLELPKEKKPMTDKQMFEIIQKLNKQFGGG